MNLLILNVAWMKEYKCLSDDYYLINGVNSLKIMAMDLRC